MTRYLTLDHVNVRLGGGHVLSGISFSAHEGEHIGIVGPNGAGKSSLLKAIAGLLPLASGNIEIDGQSADEMSVQAKARKLGYLAQERTLGWRLRVEDVAALGRHAWGGGDYASLGQADRQIVDTALQNAGAEIFFGRDATQLSGGEQARVHLARTLATDARILLLDEPCAALDIRHQLDLMNVLEVERKTGRTIITALHDLDLARRFCTRLLVLKTGEIIADGAPETVMTEALLQDVFGLNRGESAHYLPD